MKKTLTLAVRLTTKEAEALRTLAAKHSQTLSTTVRNLIAATPVLTKLDSIESKTDELSVVLAQLREANRKNIQKLHESLIRAIQRCQQKESK